MSESDKLPSFKVGDLQGPPRVKESKTGFKPPASEAQVQESMGFYGFDYTDYDLPLKWECTAKIYRKKGYKPANLAACCAKNDIDLNHHEALSDARACAKLYILAKPQMTLF